MNFGFYICKLENLKKQPLLKKGYFVRSEFSTVCPHLHPDPEKEMKSSFENIPGSSEGAKIPDSAAENRYRDTTDNVPPVSSLNPVTGDS